MPYPYSPAVKLVCLDIDGTVLNSKNQITPKVKDAIQKTAGLGIPVVLVSARMPKGVRDIQQKLEITAPLICYGGAMVLLEDGSVLYSQTIPLNTAKETAVLCRQFGVHLSLYQEDCWYAPIDQYSKKEWEIVGFGPDASPDLTDLWTNFEQRQTGPHKLMAIGSVDQISALQQALSLRGILSVLSKPTYLEILPPNTTKTNAIIQLEKEMQISSDQVLAMGDSWNDLDMITHAGIGIAMGNSPLEVRSQATLVAPTNDHDGVGIMLEQIILSSFAL